MSLTTPLFSQLTLTSPAVKSFPPSVRKIEMSDPLPFVLHTMVESYATSLCHNTTPSLIQAVSPLSSSLNPLNLSSRLVYPIFPSMSDGRRKVRWRLFLYLFQASTTLALFQSKWILDFHGCSFNIC